MEDKSIYSMQSSAAEMTGFWPSSRKMKTGAFQPQDVFLLPPTPDDLDSPRDLGTQMPTEERRDFDNAIQRARDKSSGTYKILPQTPKCVRPEFSFDEAKIKEILNSFEFQPRSPTRKALYGDHCSIAISLLRLETQKKISPIKDIFTQIAIRDFSLLESAYAIRVNKCEDIKNISNIEPINNLRKSSFKSTTGLHLTNSAISKRPDGYKYLNSNCLGFKVSHADCVLEGLDTDIGHQTAINFKESDTSYRILIGFSSGTLLDSHMTTGTATQSHRRATISLGIGSICSIHTHATTPWIAIGGDEGQIAFLRDGHSEPVYFRCFTFSPVLHMRRVTESTIVVANDKSMAVVQISMADGWMLKARVVLEHAVVFPAMPAVIADISACKHRSTTIACIVVGNSIFTVTMANDKVVSDTRYDIDSDILCVNAVAEGCQIVVIVVSKIAIVTLIVGNTEVKKNKCSLASEIVWATVAGSNMIAVMDQKCRIYMLNKEGKATSTISLMEFICTDTTEIAYTMTNAKIKINGDTIVASGNSGVSIIKREGLQAKLDQLIETGSSELLVQVMASVYRSRFPWRKSDISRAENSLESIIKQYGAAKSRGLWSSEDSKACLRNLLECARGANLMTIAFSYLRLWFGDELFWQELDLLLRNGSLRALELSQITKGSNILSLDSLLLLLMSIDLNSLSQETELLDIFDIAIRRSLWCIIYRLVMLRPGLFVSRVLQMMFDELECLKSTEKMTIIQDTIWKPKDGFDSETFIDQKPTVTSFYRFYWFIAITFQPSMLPNTLSEVFRKHATHRDQIKIMIMSWLRHPATIPRLSSISLSLCLEVCFWPICTNLWAQTDTSSSISFSHTISSVSSLSQFAPPSADFDIAFLALRAIIYSPCTDKLDYCGQIVSWLTKVVGRRFESGRLMLNYQPCQRQDVESICLTAVDMVTVDLQEVGQLAAVHG